MNVSAFFPESSFSVRISSPAECPCVSGKRAGQSLNHKPPERDPDAASLRLPGTSCPGACLGVPSARFPNGTWGWPGAGGDGTRLATRRAPAELRSSALQVRGRLLHCRLECLCALCTIMLFPGLLMEVAFGCVLLFHCTSKWSNTSSLGFKAKGCVSVIFIYI